MACAKANKSLSPIKTSSAPASASGLSRSTCSPMPSPLYIALRFIGHRKKAIILSLGGVILGVAFFICTQAQTQGFERFYIQTVLGTSGAIVGLDRGVAAAGQCGGQRQPRAAAEVL